MEVHTHLSGGAMKRRPWEIDESERQKEYERILNMTRGYPMIVSVSGGKDSTATCLWLRFLGIEYRSIHFDTGWEHPITDAYVRDVLPQYIGPIEIASYDVGEKLAPERLAIALDLEARFMGGKASGMVRRALRHASFASRMARWCTKELKIRLFHRHAKESGWWPDFVSVQGIRAGESITRTSMPEFGMDEETYMVWRPLIDWAEADVIDWHLVNDTPPNPLYTKGAARVGCFPCIYARKAEIRWVSEILPSRIELLRELEAEVSRLAKERTEAAEDPFVHPDGTPKFRAFFMNPNYDRDKRLLSIEAASLGLEEGAAELWVSHRLRAMAPIDDVLAWSKTNRAGEPEPFAPLPHEEGCSRWGFCDVSWRDAQPPQVDMFHVGRNK